MEKKTQVSKDVVRGIVRKMLDDKRAVQQYIRKNGSLIGFSDESVKFAKPL